MTDGKELKKFRVLTFDCFGTLIDWETGIYEHISTWFDTRHLTRDQLLETYATIESELESAHPTMLYSDLLLEGYYRFASKMSLEPDRAVGIKFSQSAGKWPAFPDTREALSRLNEHFKLVIVSNIDKRSIAKTIKNQLKTEFFRVFTAEEMKAYKPDHKTFRYFLTELQKEGYQRSDILHVAQSLYHDHIPAKSHGLKTVWIDRRANMEGWGATLPPDTPVQPDFHYRSMMEFSKKLKD